jgi:hypothetical protein
MRPSLLPVLGLFALGGCAMAAPGATGHACRVEAAAMARVELLFGRARPGGGAVGDAEWADFLDREVTPRFPDGLTVFDGAGQWRGRDGAIVREPSHLLVIWYRPSATSEADIEAIRAAYKKRFSQESVLRVDDVSCVAF